MYFRKEGVPKERPIHLVKADLSKSSEAERVHRVVTKDLGVTVSGMGGGRTQARSQRGKAGRLERQQKPHNIRRRDYRTYPSPPRTDSAWISL